MRKLAAKTALKAAKTDRQSAIPVEQQSIDLPAGDGTATGALEAMRAREEITEAMRRNRRKAIKEGNFLKNM
jgi:large subunit ribosomal protein L54